MVFLVYSSRSCRPRSRESDALRWGVVALLLGLGAACTTPVASTQRDPRLHDGPFEDGDPVDVNADGTVDGIAVDEDGDGTLEGVDLDRDGEADALLPGAALPGDGDGDGDRPTGDGDGDGESGDGDGDDGGDGDGDREGDGDGDDKPPVVEIVTPKVPCGASECEIKNSNVCCDSWKRAGFGSESMCITEDACVISTPDDEGLYSQSETLLGVPDPDRAVVSRCDGAEDCGANQGCCFVPLGRPISETGGPPFLGPGAGRQCMSIEDCTADFTASGAPTGVLSCNDDQDCSLVPGSRCQPEQDNSITTGKDVKARPGVSVCR